MFFLYTITVFLIAGALIINMFIQFSDRDGFMFSLNLLGFIALLVQFVMFVTTGFIHPSA